MRFLWRWFKRALLVLAVLIVALVAPILYVETGCRGTLSVSQYDPILPQVQHRLESRTFMTYPEWHIVHAYDDYARVVREGDPHDYNYLRSIGQFWSSLCALSEISAAHGGVDGATKQMVYVIGASFSVELALKAAYEETLGRLATLVRGPERAQSDDLSATQATDYAAFLQQVPWYKWDFRGDAEALAKYSDDGLRDFERSMALGLEYMAKAAYAEVIAAAVSSVGPDELTLRMVITGGDGTQFPDVRLVDQTPEGQIIETPRYRALTHLLVDMASAGVEFVEIAGNDDILFTAISPDPTHPRAIHSFARQGYGDYRHLIVVKVSSLAETLRTLDSSGLTLEHIHDY